ncbi:MAG: hypothetical protein K2X03_30025 [Bryobacteraceae bacterium]|nr:hypothetical protein [Bryobacteraceae bacterium]
MTREVLMFSLALSSLAAQPALMPVVQGPLRVAGNRLVDATGASITLRGTEAPGDLPLAYAGTMFSTIRQRFNLNTVRLPVSVERALRDPEYLPRIAELVRRANRLELFVILGAEGERPTQSTVAFWKLCARRFVDVPRVAFDLFTEPDPRWVPGHRAGVRTATDWNFWLRGGASSTGEPLVGMEELAAAVRSTGATQPILAMLFDDDLLAEGFGEAWMLRDANVIYEVCPNNRAHATDAARDRAFGNLARRVPVFAMGWDPELDQDSVNCHALPESPREVAALIRSQMTYFDAREISWSASSFTPGKLIHGLEAMEPTEIDRPPACRPDAEAVNGAGLEVQLHRWSMTRDNFITVGAGAGSIEIPQGGIAIGYAEVTTDPVLANEWPLPTSLGGVRVRITDAQGTERWAPLFYAGVGSVNFLVDAATAPGLARLDLVRLDGRPEMTGQVIVSAVAPGFFTATMNARGPVLGEWTAGDTTAHLSACDEAGCRSLPVQLVDGQARVRMPATGFRQATRIRALIGEIPVQVLRAGFRADDDYNDVVELLLDHRLAGAGEQDLIVFADDRAANVVRIRVQ